MPDQIVFKHDAREVYDKPIELPKTILPWIVAGVLFVLGGLSLFFLQSERVQRQKQDSLEAEIVKLSTKLDDLIKKSNADQEDIDKAKKQASLFLEQVRRLQAKAN